MKPPWDKAWSSPDPFYFDCNRPHSFYEMIEGISSGTGSAWPLHRLANIVRKVHDRNDAGRGKTPLSGRLQWHTGGMPDFKLDDQQLAQHLKQIITSDCLTLSLFEDAVTADEALSHVPDAKLTGYAIIKRNHATRPDTFGNVWLCIVRHVPMVNNFLNGIRTYDVQIGHRSFKITGTYFCQQNSQSSYCAQSAVAMAARALGLTVKGSEVNAATVNTLLPDCVGRGLNLEEMVSVFKKLGINPMAVDFTNPKSAKVDYRSLVHAGIESGVPVLVGFVTRDRKTGQLIRHVITILGHTLNTDTWVAEAEFGYGVTKPYRYHPSYDWCTHWLINDDNLGMLYCLQANKLASVWQRDPEHVTEMLADPELIKARHKEFDVVGVLVPLAGPAFVDVQGVEEKTMDHLELFAGQLAKILTRMGPVSPFYAKGAWIDRLMQRLDPNHPGPGPILRTRFVKKDVYIGHLSSQESCDWEGKTIPEKVVEKVREMLPSQFWMTEFTLVDLFTANRRKLGEVLYEAAWASSKKMNDGLLLTRLPGFLINHRNFEILPTSCWTHVPMLSTAASSLLH